MADLPATLPLRDRDRNRRHVNIQSNERVIIDFASPPFLRLGASQSGATLERRMPRERPPTQSVHTAIMASNRMGSQCESSKVRVVQQRRVIVTKMKFYFFGYFIII